MHIPPVSGSSVFSAYRITNTSDRVCALLSKQDFQTALDTLKDPDFKLNFGKQDTFNYLYLAVSMGKLNGPWDEVNENHERICIDIIDYLIESGNLAPHEVRMQHTALTLAMQTGSKKIVECLINHGADVNLARPDGIRPLALAIWVGSKKIVECLIEQHNADVNFLTFEITPRMLAEMRKTACQDTKHQEVVEYLRSLDLPLEKTWMG